MRLFTLFLSLCTLAWGQAFQGSLRGRVTDSSDALVPLAKVTILEEATSVSSSTITNTQGEYSFPAIKPSTYTLVVEASGFKKFEQRGIVVSTQSSVTQDVTMSVGEVTETVNVSADVAPLLETSEASTGQVLDRQKLEDLPNLGRNPFILSRLSETVVWTGNPKFDRMQDQNGSSQISIAGGPVSANNYTLDGIAITDSTNRAVIIPDQESVEEVKVQANTYDAEMGRTGGGVFNTTLRSGTNQLHGSAFLLLRETDWLANNFFANRAGQPIPDQPFKNYGDSLGGPVWIPKIYDGRHKTFFFASTEGYRQYDAASSTLAVPTDLERRGDFSQSFTTSKTLQTMYDPLSTTSAGVRTAFPGNIVPANRLSQIGLNMASYYPEPNGPTTYYGQPNFTSTVRAFNRADQGTFKLDHSLFSWLKISGSYLHYGSQEPSNRWFPNQTATPNQGIIYRKVDATQANATATVNPTTVITARFGYNRFPNFTPPISRGFRLTALGFPASVDALTPNYPAFPSLSTGEFASYGGGTTSQSVYYSTSWNFGVTKFMGKHSVKFGVDWRALHSDAITSEGPSSFGFTSGFTSQTPTKTVSGTGGGLATMLLGYPSSGSIALGTNFYDYVHYWALFVQDDFRVSSKLTLNIGFRGEHESNPSERNNKFAIDADMSAVNPLQASIPSLVLKGAFRYAGAGNPNHAGNPLAFKLGPRFGFAYKIDSKTAIRGGYGIFWIPQSFSAQNATGYSQTTSIVTSTDNNYTPAATLNNPYPNGLLQPVGNALGGATAIGQGVSAIDQGNRSPGYVEQFSFDVQRQLDNTDVVSAGYIGSHTLKQPYNLGLNELNPAYYALGSLLNSPQVANPFYGLAPNTVTLGNSPTISRSNLLVPYPEYTSVTLATPMGRSIYYAFYAKIQRRLSHGLTLLATYTWSRNMTLLTGPQTNYAPVVPQQWGRASTDEPNNYSMAVTYQLPFGEGKQFLSHSRWLDLAVGGWTVNATNLIHSGTPLSVSQTNNNSNFCNGCGQRPMATGMNAATSGSTVDRINGWLNLSAFSLTPAYAFGNVGPSLDIYGPGLYNWDVSMFKTFRIRERVNAQFRAESLNVTNTVLFANPGSLTITSTTSKSNFATITSQTNYPRLIQLGFRVTF